MTLATQVAGLISAGCSIATLVLTIRETLRRRRDETDEGDDEQ